MTIKPVHFYVFDYCLDLLLIHGSKIRSSSYFERFHSKIANSNLRAVSNMTLRRDNSDKYELCSERALRRNRFKMRLVSNSCSYYWQSVIFSWAFEVIRCFKRKTKQWHNSPWGKEKGTKWKFHLKFKGLSKSLHFFLFYLIFHFIFIRLNNFSSSPVSPLFRTELYNSPSIKFPWLKGQ